MLFKHTCTAIEFAYFVIADGSVSLNGICSIDGFTRAGSAFGNCYSISNYWYVVNLLILNLTKHYVVAQVQYNVAEDANQSIVSTLPWDLTHLLLAHLFFHNKLHQTLPTVERKVLPVQDLIIAAVVPSMATGMLRELRD
jgi:hypothetical protein